MINAAVVPSFNHLLTCMPGAWGCKDINSVFLYANSEYKEIMGLSNHDDITGLTDYDLPALTISCVRLFRKQDKKIIKTGEPLKIIDIYSHNDGRWKAYFFIKSPLIDENNKIVGVVFHGHDVTDTITIELGSVLLQNFADNPPTYSIEMNQYNPDKNIYAPKLTNRQTEVLFYFLRGKTVKQTAKIMNISIRTVEDHLFQLKEKFITVTKNELIEKSLLYGYLRKIPASLFRKQLLLEIN